MHHTNLIKRSKSGERLFRDFIIPEPLETLVTLNTFYETISNLDDEFSNPDKFLKSFVEGMMYTVRTPPINLPVSVRRQLLADIGFTDPEIVEILTSTKCCRYSDTSTNLLYTSSEFVPTMKSRLELLRTEASNLGIISAVKFWAVLTNWSVQVEVILTYNYADLVLTIPYLYVLMR